MRQIPLPLKGPYLTEEDMWKIGKKVLKDQDSWWLEHWFPNQIEGLLAQENKD